MYNFLKQKPKSKSYLDFQRMNKNSRYHTGLYSKVYRALPKPVKFEGRIDVKEIDMKFLKVA